jgi:hypothetical protein
MIEHSDSTNPKSLRGRGPYDPSGPEAKIRNLKSKIITRDIIRIKTG